MAMTRPCWTGARFDAGNIASAAACWFHSLTTAPDGSGTATFALLPDIASGSEISFCAVMPPVRRDKSEYAMFPLAVISGTAEWAIAPGKNVAIAVSMAPMANAITSLFPGVFMFISVLLLLLCSQVQGQFQGVAKSEMLLLGGNWSGQIFTVGFALSSAIGLLFLSRPFVR
jgi:hypothetical protein